ncbi:hypothetical protein JMJ56_23530 [Belnapia sp. T18]|uniref:Transposase DDE domain-containing protein n=1 Tax=Belnapia arida TaxID=2804533 RepID=A0ABS1U8J8_9PROT|nr:hypothetical protein [Belnapia arida]MBL6080989.1 hypothetical protein [Belnapia arida]
MSGQERDITSTIRRERRRHSAIEPVIGHMKNDGHLGRNSLRGTEGDGINVILAAADHTLHLLRALLAWLSTHLLSLSRSTHRLKRDMPWATIQTLPAASASPVSRPPLRVPSAPAGTG